MELALALIDCTRPARSAGRAAVSPLDLICGRSLVDFVAAAAIGAFEGDVLLRTWPGEAESFRVAGLLSHPRVAVADDARVLELLAQARTRHVLVLDGCTPLLTATAVSELLAAPNDDPSLPARARDGSAVVATAEVVARALRSSGDSGLLQALLDGTEPGSGIFDLSQLEVSEQRLYARIADEWRRRGVRVRGAAMIDATVEIEPGAVIETGAHLRGSTRVAAGARVDVGAILTDVEVGPRAIVKPYTIATKTRIGEAAEVGPFSHLRLDSDIQQNARIGNFVETKNVIVRAGAMANHLAYMGDGEVGEGANISAGTIFCNSDGVNKHRTLVGAGAFVGSDCQLVAPVTIGPGAFVATGTTVTADVPADALAISRPPQQNKEGYAPKLRAKFAAIARERKGNT